MRGNKLLKSLVLYEQSLLRLCSLYFTQFIYIDKANTEIRYTLRENGRKLTIVKLYHLSKEMFDREGVELDDIVGALEQSLLDYEEDILIDPINKKMYEDWETKLRKFIDNNLFHLVKQQIEDE
mmetsp:Transcript_43139/g.31514  ORF Transcript_43139/g.31514 Transcript_43139/m.31514 type:complete len:124 (+) Transcript_43139:1553-1924(+)